MTAGEQRLTELALIRAVRARAWPDAGVAIGIGDDAAVLEPTPGRRLVLTTDLLIEDIHFRRRYTEPADIGWKALAVNLSDVAAMGAAPRWSLVALACPPGTTMDEVEAFYEGLAALAAEHHVALVGGDTSASPGGWIVNVTVIGETDGIPLTRAGARPGNVIAITGDVGRSAAGHAVLERRRAPTGLPADVLAAVTDAHLRPRPRVREARWLAAAGGVTAMIDLSDGLATDLRHLARESGVGARVDLARLPVAPTTRLVARALGRDPLAWAAAGGEDYELLLACERSAFDRLRIGLAEATGTDLTGVGEVVAGEGDVTFVGEDGRAVEVAGGFEHFVTGARRG
ncbi:MAG TPA: thiamine-phosphate kinase [Candidatus Binatia bacterium]|nr:thiamine-phosphate kinase [Candidatus Binatia bacterium]